MTQEREQGVGQSVFHCLQDHGSAAGSPRLRFWRATTDDDEYYVYAVAL
jgi:hypothetical protein